GAAWAGWAWTKRLAGVASSGVLRQALAERPILLFHLHQVDEDVVGPQSGVSRQPLGDAGKQPELLRHAAGIADGELDDGQGIGVFVAEVARRVHDLATRCMFADDLKQILLRHVEGFDQSSLYTLRNGPV